MLYAVAMGGRADSELTEAAVGDVTDPVVALTREVPGFQRVVAPDHGVVSIATKP